MKQRTMRKNQNALSWEQTVEILQKQQEGVMGIHGLDNYPYCVPMNYLFADNTIIMHTAAEGYKLDCLNKNPRVSFTVYNVLEVKPTTSNWECAMIFGEAEIVTDVSIKDKYMRMLAGKFGDAPQSALPADLLNRIGIIVIHIDEFSGKLKPS